MTIEQLIVLLGLILTPVASYGASRYAGRSTIKAKQIDIDAAAYARANEINEGLFKNLREQIETSKSHIAELKKDIERIDSELEEVKTHNNQLINFCYRLISIIRRGGNESDIPQPPHGIYL